jgi:YidC/Oxa1 family membrane protein insertase
MSGMNEMMSSSLGKGLMYGLPTLSLVFIAFQPAALQLYFAASGILAFLQAYLLNTPATRSMLGMVPIPPEPSALEREQSRLKLRMIQEQTATYLQQYRQKQTEMKAAPTKEDNKSRIDKMMDNAKKEVSNMRTEMGEKMEQLKGKTTGMNADGSHVVKPRLTDAQKKEAQAYKVLRDEEDKARYMDRISGSPNRTRNKSRSSKSKKSDRN